MIGHAAHRDGAARRVLRARRQRQLERARGHQRILVEHLVEVAHPEEHDGVADTAASRRGTAASRASATRLHAPPWTRRFREYRHSSVRSGEGRPGPRPGAGRRNQGRRAASIAVCATRVDFVRGAVYNGRDVTILALDTSTHAGSVALRRDGALLGEHVGSADVPHARRLPGEVLDLLRLCGVPLGDVTCTPSPPGPARSRASASASPRSRAWPLHTAVRWSASRRSRRLHTPCAPKPQPPASPCSRPGWTRPAARCSRRLFDTIGATDSSRAVEAPSVAVAARPRSRGGPGS